MAAELNTRFATILLASGMPQAGEGCLLDCEAVGSQLSVRNWRPGDRIRMEHRKSPKKIKELLQEKHLTGRQRKLWPVVVLQNEVVWLRGFPPAAKFCAKPGRPAVLLQEISVLGRRAQVKQSEGQP